MHRALAYCRQHGVSVRSHEAAHAAASSTKNGDKATQTDRPTRTSPPKNCLQLAKALGDAQEGLRTISVDNGGAYLPDSRDEIIPRWKIATGCLVDRITGRTGTISRYLRSMMLSKQLATRFDNVPECIDNLEFTNTGLQRVRIHSLRHSKDAVSDCKTHPRFTACSCAVVWDGDLSTGTTGHIHS
jgi:hypothetical protein